MQPDDRKVQAIHKMKPPETKEDVKRPLGMINYLAKFMPHQIAKKQSSLLKEDTTWEWSTQHEQENEWRDGSQTTTGNN